MKYQQFEQIHCGGVLQLTSIHVDLFGTRLVAATEARELLLYSHKNGAWVLDNRFDSKHDGPIWKVKWAPSDFGPIFATGKIKSIV